MITAEMNQILYLNRKSEKALLQKQELLSKINLDVYSNLIASLISALFSYYLPLIMIQYSDELGIAKSTTYLAKSYLDNTIKISPSIEQSQLSLVSICCIMIAVKFNEPRSISDQFSIHAIRAQSNGEFTLSSLQQTQMRILLLLNFKLAVTTPYHYISPFFQCFPWLLGIKRIMPMMIDFAISMPELSSFSGHSLFLGTFLATCNIKQCTFTPLQNKVFTSQSNNIEQIQYIANQIASSIQKISQQSPMDQQTTSTEILQ